MIEPDSSVCVLLGGGIDSACLIPYYIGRRTKVMAAHFDYGQPSLSGELKAASELCNYYEVPLIRHKLGFKLQRSGDAVHARNALFLMAAAGLVESNTRLIALGIHAGTNYYDASTEFIGAMKGIVDGYFSGTLEIDVPFIGFSKLRVFELAQNLLLPFELTFSCDRSGDRPCGDCFSCMDMRFLREHSRSLQKA